LLVPPVEASVSYQAPDHVDSSNIAEFCSKGCIS